MLVIKKIASVLTAAVMLSGGTINASAKASGDYFYDLKEDGTALIDEYRGKAAKVTVPAVIDGIAVSELYQTFFKNEDVTSVNIQNGIKTVGYAAFTKCYNLETVVMPDSVEEIGVVSFAHCVKLKNFKMPKNLKELSFAAFSCCVNLEEVNIPKGVTVIPEQCFWQCGFTTMVIPSGVTTIESNAFTNCSKLKIISLPDSVTEIGDDVFENTSEDLNIICSKGSEAYKYARNQKLGYALTGDVERGDADGSGDVGMKDLTTLQRKINGWPVDTYYKGDDVDGNYEIDMKDMAALQRKLNS